MKRYKRGETPARRCATSLPFLLAAAVARAKHHAGFARRSSSFSFYHGASALLMMRCARSPFRGFIEGGSAYLYFRRQREGAMAREQQAGRGALQALLRAILRYYYDTAKAARFYSSVEYMMV